MVSVNGGRGQNKEKSVERREEKGMGQGDIVIDIREKIWNGDFDSLCEVWHKG